MKPLNAFVAHSYSMVAILFWGLLASPPGRAQTLDRSQRQCIDDMMHEIRRTANLPGISLAIARADDLIYAKGYGYADVGNKIPMSTETTLRTASVAKVITATALGRLATLGVLEFDRPVSAYLPNTSTIPGAVTLRELASHTSGLAHNPVRKGDRKRSYETATAVLQRVVAESRASPGDAYGYSTFGYTVLAAVIESVTDMPFGAYVASQLFEPLGMRSSYAEDVDHPRDAEAQLYRYNAKKSTYRRIKRSVNGSYKLAGAGFRTTPTDLVKMMTAYGSEFISANVREQMFRSTLVADGNSTWTGIGWRTNRDVKNQIIYDHAGFWEGTRSVIVYYPDAHLGVSIMINADAPLLIEQMAQAIVQVILHEGIQVPPASRSFTAEIRRIDGTIEKGSAQIYASSSGMKFNVQSSLTSLQEATLLPLSKNNYAIIFPSGILNLIVDDAWENGNIYLIANRNPQRREERNPFIKLKHAKLRNK